MNKLQSPIVGDTLTANLFAEDAKPDCLAVANAGAIARIMRDLPLDEKIATLNAVRAEIAKESPFSAHPVDMIRWVPAVNVGANDYNPNSVAPPEMKLLEHSILNDGYTQPIVTWDSEGQYEVIDGFHRSRVGKESKAVGITLLGYLPVVVANDDRRDKGDRMAATIRHNRARGKHKVDSMSDIVVDLKKRNWSDEKIGRELGMDPDEVLRLCQISGLAEMFKDREFSEAWEAENINNPEDLDLSNPEELE